MCGIAAAVLCGVDVCVMMEGSVGRAPGQFPFRCCVSLSPNVVPDGGLCGMGSRPILVPVLCVSLSPDAVSPEMAERASQSRVFFLPSSNT